MTHKYCCPSCGNTHSPRKVTTFTQLYQSSTDSWSPEEIVVRLHCDSPHCSSSSSDIGEEEHEWLVSEQTKAEETFLSRQAIEGREATPNSPLK